MSFENYDCSKEICVQSVHSQKRKKNRIMKISLHDFIGNLNIILTLKRFEKRNGNRGCKSYFKLLQYLI